MISRRRFIQSAVSLPIAAHGSLAFAGRETDSELLLIGTQTSGTSKGIYAYRFDSSSGELKQMGLAAESDNPTFLVMASDGKTVFSVNELEEYQGKKSGAVSSFTFDRATAKFAAVNVVASLGGSPCHVAVHKSGRCVFAANYSGGSVASYLVGPGGRLSEAVSFFQYSGSGPDPERQTGPHAHRVTVSPDGHFVMVNDLGLDKIHIYKLDAKTAKLVPNEPAEWRSSPGAGPRALQFHPNRRWAYCVTEMKSTVNVLHWKAQQGALETIQEVSLLPEGYKGETGASDIVLDRTGRFAYVANRLNDFLATFTVSPEDGKLTLVERTSCGGMTPRHLALDKTERWLLVANQKTDNLAVFARDTRTGRIAQEGKSFPLSRPQCLMFV